MNQEIMHHDPENAKDILGYIHKPTQHMRIKLAREMIKEDIEKMPGNKLLSVGCSTGDIEVPFQDMGLQTYGVDGEHSALINASKKGIVSTVGDLRDSLPYANDTFDFVFAGEVIEHIMNTRVFLTDIHRVMKPGGGNSSDYSQSRAYRGSSSLSFWKNSKTHKSNTRLSLSPYTSVYC